MDESREVCFRHFKQKQGNCLTSDMGENIRQIEFSKCGAYCFVVSETERKSAVKVSILNVLQPESILAETLIHTQDARKLQITNLLIQTEYSRLTPGQVKYIWICVNT